MLVDIFYRTEVICKVPGTEEHAPYSYAGRIVAAKPSGEGKPFRVRHNRAVAMLDLTEQEYADARNGRAKIDVAGEPRLVPVSWEDRWGYVADKIPLAAKQTIEAHYTWAPTGDEAVDDATEKAYQEARALLDVELEKMPRPEADVKEL